MDFVKPINKAEISFQEIREIGKDGMNSTVILAHDPQLKCDVVVKRIPKSDFKNVLSFFEEAQRLYAASHNNVVQVRYACQDEHNIFIVMPFYKNGSLKGVLEERSLDLRSIIRYSCHILSGLHNIHSKKLVHCDIKPDNILISDNDEAMISDFGVSLPVDDEGFVTPGKMFVPIKPPEAHLVGWDISATADIYQFGLTLYQMCTSVDSFWEAVYDCDGHSFQAIRLDKLPAPDSLPPHIPSRIHNIIRKCVALDPNDRYQSAIEVVNALSDVDDGLLDWEYTRLSDSQVWVREFDGIRRILTLKNGSCSGQRQLRNGNIQNVSAMSFRPTRNSDIRKALGKF